MSVEPPRQDVAHRQPWRGRTETLVVSCLALAAVAMAAVGLVRGRPEPPELHRAPHGHAPSGGAGGAELAPRRIDINSAPAEEIQLVPGIGPVLSRRIVEYRERRGSFERIWDLGRVRGIGPRLIERIAAYVVVGRPLQEEPRGVKNIPGAVER